MRYVKSEVNLLNICPNLSVSDKYKMLSTGNTFEPYWNFWDITWQVSY
jgi:hypothetical protein